MRASARIEEAKQKAMHETQPVINTNQKEKVVNGGGARHSSLQRPKRNNMMAHTLNGGTNGNFLPGLNHDIAKHMPQINPLNFSKLGSINVGTLALPSVSSAKGSHRLHRDNFLRKHQGNGGSPVTLETNRLLNNSTELSSARNQVQRDKTTVRIRTKGNQFMYQEGSFAHPLYSVKNETVRKNAYSTLNNSNQQIVDSLPSQRQSPSIMASYKSSGAHSPSERDRIQNLLFRYREEKLQKEIEKIEEERRKAEEDKLKAREGQTRLKIYNEQLKEKLAQHQ